MEKHIEKHLTTHNKFIKNYVEYNKNMADQESEDNDISNTVESIINSLLKTRSRLFGKTTNKVGVFINPESLNVQIGTFYYEGESIDRDKEVFDKIKQYGDSKIIRFIEFPPEYYQAGINILSSFGNILRQKYPNTKASVQIKQEGLKVTMIIDPGDKGERETIERVLNDYGDVLTGHISPDDFFPDSPIKAFKLKEKLALSCFELPRGHILKNLLLQQEQFPQSSTLENVVYKQINLVNENSTINENAASKNIEIQFLKEERHFLIDEIKWLRSHISDRLKHSNNLIDKKEVNMGDIYNINQAGDMAIAKDKAIAKIHKTVSGSPNVTGELENKLKQLSDAVDKIIPNLENEQANEAIQSLEKLTDEAIKDKPNKRWYDFSADGLIEAAKTVGSIGQPVIDTTKQILKLLGS